MRMRWVAPLALMLLAPAMADAAGTDGKDDPLAALEGGELGLHANKKAAKTGGVAPLAAVTPAHPALNGALPRPETREELPASYNAPTVFGMPVPPPPPASWPGGGSTGGPPPTTSGLWPTPPTAPTLPAVVAPTVPVWNFGTQ